MICTATTKDSQPCRMRAVRGTDPATCFNHTPGHAAAVARADARAAGGRMRGIQQQLGEQEAVPDDADHSDWINLWTPEEIQKALAHVARQTILGKMPAKEAAAATNALKALLERAVEDEHHYEADADEASADGGARC